MMITVPLIKLFRTPPTVSRPKGAYGISIYPDLDYGTVRRWDRGFRHRPTVIHWAVPHCADDQCGSPCAHG